MRRSFGERSEMFYDTRYEKLAQVPIPLWGWISEGKRHEGRELVQVQSVWSSRVPLLKKMLKTNRVSILSCSDSDGKFQEISSLSFPYAFSE